MPRKKKAPAPPPGPPYHGSTPRSVLEAPKLVPVMVHEAPHPNRETRRLLGVGYAWGHNEPYVRTTPRKTRRGRMARFNH